jgi:hypothetical protein
MRNRRGGVVRYNRHVYTHSDWFGVGAAPLELREMASAAVVVSNWSVCTIVHTKLDRCQGKCIFCLTHVFLITLQVVR